MPKELPDCKYLRQILAYDKHTGVLRWRERPSQPMFRYAGMVALGCINSHGYSTGTIAGVGGVKAHRVIWKMMTGEDVEMIDHINGNRSDNRWCNLRASDPVANARNLGISKNNTSGYNGVYWYPNYRKWMVSIRVDGKRKTLGYFAKKKDAISARRSADEKHGYTFRGEE